MKKLSIITLAALVAASVACTKTYEPTVKEDVRTVNFLAQSIDTKTAFGTPDGSTYPTLWTSNDTRVKVNTNGILNSNNDAFVTVSDDKLTASFSADLSKPDASEFTFRVVSPASAAIGYATKGWSLEIPASQSPTATSVDESAMIIAAKSETFDTYPTSTVALDFAHVTAYGKLSVTNLSASAGAVSKVTLTSDVNLVGRFHFDDTNVSENSASNVLTLNTTSLSDLWFACAPVEVGGKTVTITVTTENGDFSKTITFPAGKKFEAGKIAKFTVDFNGVTSSEDVFYSLVTSIDQITVDSEVIIANGTAAISTTQNNNNRAVASITLEDGKIKNPSSAVQILTIKKGAEDETIALYTGTGYLYAASSTSNHLKTQTTLNANGSFAVAFNGNDITLSAKGSNTRNTIKYNDGTSTSTPTTPVFSCYTSSSTMLPVKMYKKEGSGTSTPAVVIKPQLATPVIKSCSGSESTMTISVTWDDVANATNYHVVCGAQSTDVAAGVASAQFTVTSYGTYSVTVTAQADGYKSATSTASSVVLVDPTPSTDLSTGEISSLTASTSSQNLNDHISYKMSAANTYSSPLRVYSKNTLTLTAVSGYTITKVVFDCSSEDYATACNGATTTVASGASVTSSVNSDVVTFTVTGTSSSFEIKPSAQFRVDSIYVYYKAIQ